MGLLDYFKKDAADARRREGARAKLSNMYYQQQDRMAAADVAFELAKAGDTEAISVLLVRFEHLCPSTTVDREEKEHVVNLLVALGAQAEPVLVDYCLNQRRPIYWPVRVLEQLWPAARLHEFIAEVLERTDNEYWRDPEKKIGLVQMAAPIEGERITAALVPFIEDQLEEVRFTAVDALVSRSAPVPDALFARLLEEESGRVISRIVDAFVQQQWRIAGAAEAVVSKLPRGYRLAGDVIVRS